METVDPLPAQAVPFASRRWLFVGCGVNSLLNLLDWCFTWQLLNQDCAYEANPLAAEVLSRFGWSGLAIFKFLLVAVFLGVGAFVWIRSPRMAQLLMGIGCLLAITVVGYSTALLVAQDSDDLHHLKMATQQTKGLKRCFAAQEKYIQRLHELARQLVQEKCNLAEATANLDVFLREIRYDPVPQLQFWYHGERTMCLAAHLVRMVGLEVADNPLLASKKLKAMSRQFVAYQGPLPKWATESYKPD